MSLFLTKSEQGIVVFHFFKNLSYGIRILTALGLIAAGLYLQYHYFSLLPGIVLVFAGNLLLLVRGYDNRVKLGVYRNETEWVPADDSHLEKVVSLNRKIQKWDISATDITSGLGAFVFLLVLIAILTVFAINPFHSIKAHLIVVLNALVLFLPHWFTGVKRATTAPALVNKIKLFQDLIKNTGSQLKEHQVSYLMLLEGKDKKMPGDVKLKIKLKDQPEDFLGFYGQISMNNVQGTDYPYFYVVLVARESSGMISQKRNAINLPSNLLAEFSRQNDAEILVIRQQTTKKTGYHTTPATMELILKNGLEAAGRII